MNLFGTVLTYPAPSANYRGESELNRTTMQKITDGRSDYPIISPEAMRNAIRETLSSYGLPMNRSRLHDEKQLAVHFKSLPDPDVFADDFLFGYLVAAGDKERKKIMKELADQKRDGARFTFKRDSVLRMNLAKGLEPYRHGTVFTQSPMSADKGDQKTAYANDRNSSLLHRETTDTAFQYPFALSLNDCAQGNPEWTIKLLQAIGELNGVAGNHARSYFEMAPASIVLRLTDQLVAGYKTYGFQHFPEQSQLDTHSQFDFPEVIGGLLQDPPDYPPTEFYFGGRIVKEMSDKKRQELEAIGVTMDRNSQRLLETIGKSVRTLLEANK